MAPELLFVYGSLRAGASAHRLLESCSRDADGALSGCSLEQYRGYPMLCPGVGQVSGEVYQVEAERWPALDAWEEAPEVYARVHRQLDDGRWVWVYQRPG